MPHLFHLDIIEGFLLLVLRIVVDRRLRSCILLNIPLENNDEEFAVLSLRDLNQKLDSSPLQAPDKKDFSLVWHAEWLSFLARLHVTLVPQPRLLLLRIVYCLILLRRISGIQSNFLTFNQWKISG